MYFSNDEVHVLGLERGNVTALKKETQEAVPFKSLLIRNTHTHTGGRQQKEQTQNVSTHNISGPEIE